ncbi:MAG: ketopantoate reductase family protein [Thermomicrobiales bacterium]
MARWPTYDRVLIVGAGALGGLFAARLAAAGCPVMLFHHRPAVVAALRAQGLVVEERDGWATTWAVASTARPDEAAAGVELVLVCVKHGATRAALAPFAGRLSAETGVLSLQNSQSNEVAISAALGERVALALGVTAQGATLLGPGRVRHAGAGPTTFGWADPARAPDVRLAAIAATFQAAGLPASVTSDAAGAIWDKLVVNAAINPVAALTALPNGALPGQPGLVDVMREVLAEALAVRRAAGPPTTEDVDAALARTLAVCAATAANHASMLQDVDAGRPTEIDAINGALVKLGARHQVATPLNAALTALVKGIGIGGRG